MSSAAALAGGTASGSPEASASADNTTKRRASQAKNVKSKKVISHAFSWFLSNGYD